MIPLDENVLEPTPSEPVGPSGKAGALIQLRANEPSYRFALVMFFILFTAMMIGVPFSRKAKTTDWIMVAIVAGILIVVFIRVRGAYLRRRIVREVRLSRDVNAESIAHATICQEHYSTSYAIACLEFVKALAADGRVGETILLWRRTRCEAVSPIHEPFEAMLLDESDGAFEELDAALRGDEKLIEKMAERRRRSQGDAWGIRQVRRNIQLTGGTWIFGLFLFNVVLQAIRSASQGRVTGQLVLWSFYLLMYFLVPFGRKWWKSEQWWAMPGGVAYRYAGLFDRKGKVHLFDRRNSVLCLYEGFRRTWVLAVADRTTSAMRHATIKEVNFLLHAWLSPIEPPPAEKLIDLQ